MTKKKVDAALAALRRSEHDAIDDALSGVSQTFLRKRLRHLITADGPDSGAAKVLWNRLGLRPSQDVAGIALGEAQPQARRIIPRLLRLNDALELERPESFLDPLSRTLGAASSDERLAVDLDEVKVAQAWALVGIAALARRDGPSGLALIGSKRSPAAQFAHAIGLNGVVHGVNPPDPSEPQRTYPLHRVTRMDEIEKASSRISTLMIREDEDSRRTLYYVLVELLRNVVQHSNDPLGGVVAAQRMGPRQGYPRPVIQVAVADAGRGIMAALSSKRPNLDHPQAALNAALEPHISGAFTEQERGSRYNAGLGLFFIAEMAKLTAGRLMVATRGAALFLMGDLEGLEEHTLSFVKPEGTGFPGTLVAFELPLDEVQDHDALLETIRDKATTRTPRETTRHILRPAPTPAGVPTFAVAHLAENTVEAEDFAARELKPRVLQREAVALDFRDIDVCTQSFLHALLYETLRLAWAMQTEIYVAHVGPAVLSGLKLVESYALAP